MYTLYARNNECQDSIFVDVFTLKNEAFDFSYKHKHSLYAKGGWAIEIRDAMTGLIVSDDRLLA